MRDAPSGLPLGRRCGVAGEGGDPRLLWTNGSGVNGSDRVGLLTWVAMKTRHVDGRRIQHGQPWQENVITVAFMIVAVAIVACAVLVLRGAQRTAPS
jgi:hypothetical protein